MGDSRKMTCDGLTNKTSIFRASIFCLWSSPLCFRQKYCFLSLGIEPGEAPTLSALFFFSTTEQHHSNIHKHVYSECPDLSESRLWKKLNMKKSFFLSFFQSLIFYAWGVLKECSWDDDDDGGTALHTARHLPHFCGILFTFQDR